MTDRDTMVENGSGGWVVGTRAAEPAEVKKVDPVLFALGELAQTLNGIRDVLEDLEERVSNLEKVGDYAEPFDLED